MTKLNDIDSKTEKETICPNCNCITAPLKEGRNTCTNCQFAFYVKKSRKAEEFSLWQLIGSILLSLFFFVSSIALIYELLFLDLPNTQTAYYFESIAVLSFLFVIFWICTKHTIYMVKGFRLYREQNAEQRSRIGRG